METQSKRIAEQYQFLRAGLIGLAILVTGSGGVVSLAWGHDDINAQSAQHQERHVMGVHVEITMKDGRYHVVTSKKTEQADILLKAGQPTTMILRNEGHTAHEFVTPLFLRTEVSFAGKAVGIFGRDAAGFRLTPGQQLELRFTAPFSQPFSMLYEVGWCSLHQTPLKSGDVPSMRREFLIVATDES